MSAPTTWTLKSSANTWRRSATRLSLREGRFHVGLVERFRRSCLFNLYGQTADMDRILELAEGWNLIVIEGACQAHGAEHFSRKNKRWERAGSMGKAAAFSFYPAKNLGACGEAGAVTTDDPDLAQRGRMLRDHCQAEKNY